MLSDDRKGRAQMMIRAGADKNADKNTEKNSKKYLTEGLHSENSDLLSKYTN